MGLFDKLFDKKKEVQKNNNEDNAMSNTSNAILEKMLSEDDSYSHDKTLKILETLQKSELFQFTDNPVEGEQASYRILTFTQQVNNKPMKLIAAFTNHMAMKSIMKEQAFFCASSVNFFDSISSTVISDENLDGIVVNPQQQNYIITKNTLINWNNYKLNLQNERLLKLIEEKMASPESELAGNYFDIIILMQKAYLPFPIVKMADGNENLFVSLVTLQNEEKWIYIFTNTDEITRDMQNNNLEVVSIQNNNRMLDRIMKDVVKNNFKGIVVNPYSRQFKIPFQTCKMIIESNEKQK